MSVEWWKLCIVHHLRRSVFRRNHWKWLCGIREHAIANNSRGQISFWRIFKPSIFIFKRFCGHWKHFDQFTCQNNRRTSNFFSNSSRPIGKITWNYRSISIRVRGENQINSNIEFSKFQIFSLYNAHSALKIQKSAKINVFWNNLRVFWSEVKIPQIALLWILELCIFLKFYNII